MRAAQFAGIVVLLGALSTSGQQAPAPSASFPSETAAITVDALVLDHDGQPVRGLTQDDFTVLEDGHAQTIVAFEARDMAAPGASPQPSGTPPTATEAAPSASAEEVASNDRASVAPGRTMALVIDDLGLSAVTAGQLKPALAGWLRERADPRDEITIMTTSGDVWWSDTVARGRSDLIASLERVTGKRLTGTQRAGELSPWESYQIATYGSLTQLPRYGQPRADGGATVTNPSNPGDTGNRTDPASLKPHFEGNTPLDRVLQRWFDLRLCECNRRSFQESPPCATDVRRCMNEIQAVAREGEKRWMLRARATLATLANLSRSLSTVKGRKSILLVSEDFLQDDSLGKPVREAIAALQRGNAAVYFLGARGLTAGSTFSAAQDLPTLPRDVMNMTTEETTLATAGGVALADDTGGVAITSSNDLASGLERMALDASSYYLLGYQPQREPDGKWHKLEVKVRRPGLTVRARKRYLAERPEDLARAAEEGQRELEKLEQKNNGKEKGNGKGKNEKDKDEKANTRPLAPGILTGTARGSLPLRLSSYIEDTDGTGRARIELAVEIESDRVRLERADSSWRAALDFTVLVAGLDRPPEVPLDERLNLSLERNDGNGGWWLIRREAWLPPGAAQVRVFVRDVLSGAEGLVTQRLVVPDVEQPYLSTPIVTDRALPGSKPDEPPRLVPTAQRRFEKGRNLFLQYEVNGFGGQSLEGIPQLVGSYTLKKAGGPVVSEDQPTPIQTKGYHAVRRIMFPAGRLAAGPYELVVQVEDLLARRTMTARTDFVIEGGSEKAAPQAR